MGLVKEEEAILEEKDRETTGISQRSERAAAQSISVEGMEDVGEEEYEWGEHHPTPVVESLSTPTWTKSAEEGPQAKPCCNKRYSE